MYLYRKYPRICLNTMTKSTQFFPFSLFLSLSFFLVFFFCFPSLFPFLRIIYYGFFTISSIHVWVRCWRSFFFPLLLPFLESSILSCKATRSLFRHHLHINAARGLAGQHLMQRQQYPQIFVFSHSYPLFDIFSFTLLQGLSDALP